MDNHCESFSRSKHRITSCVCLAQGCVYRTYTVCVYRSYCSLKAPCHCESWHCLVSSPQALSSTYDEVLLYIFTISLVSTASLNICQMANSLFQCRMHMIGQCHHRNAMDYHSSNLVLMISKMCSTSCLATDRRSQADTKVCDSCVLHIATAGQHPDAYSNKNDATTWKGPEFHATWWCHRRLCMPCSLKKFLVQKQHMPSYLNLCSLFDMCVGHDRTPVFQHGTGTPCQSPTSSARPHA